ncbi:PREDICTED: uncharacterized protein LOC109356421 [Lupinus angustifolius]|uniref:uncharacterized protein LOC109356421 n=1 Tax=Lupinus angustifolius TaxID=3871 RepID=UPI00092FD213|nr:PREDICTED: uncharacterized protein LOC109356421 [Lupinus angustifolius]
MASSLSSSFSLKPRGSSFKGCHRHHGMPIIKVQNYQDEGRSTNIVDANLNVLKERVKMVKVKEQLEKCCNYQHGWNYNYVPGSNNYKIKIIKEFCGLIELTCLVFGTLGFTCFGGTLLVCLVSLLVHMQ